MSVSEMFNQRLHDSLDASIALGYRPSRFIEMIASTDAVSLAKSLFDLVKSKTA